MDATVHVRIHGHSMWPTYDDQQIVPFRRKGPEETVPAGTVVLAQHPLKPNVRVVKRVRHLTEDGRLFRARVAAAQCRRARAWTADASARSRAVL